MAIFFLRRSSLFLLAITSTLLLSRDHFEKIDAHQLMHELEQEYLYCGKNSSKLFDLVDQLCTFEADKNSPVWLLRSYISAGYVVGAADSILEVLEYAEQRLDEIYKNISSQQAEEMYTNLYLVMHDIKRGALSIDPQSFSSQTRDCGDAIIPLGQTIKVREKLYVLRSAKFFKNVEFKDDVEFEAPVTFEDNVTIEGLLSAADEIVGCNLTVGCNINMSNSTSGLEGNIVKDGVLFMNNFGIDNTFVGANAGNFTMTGTDNTGFGFNTLMVNTSGPANTAVGSFALPANTSGVANTAVGVDALLQNTSGGFNTALGGVALQANTTGFSNTAVGFAALASNISGNANIALGIGAGSSLTSGNNNIYIANSGNAVESNIIRIGTLGTQAACFIQGISGVTTVGAAVPVLVAASGQLGTISSSATRKHDIQDMADVSETIYKLRPVTFVYNGDATETIQYGLIAEEVDEVFPEIVVNNRAGKPETVQYHVLPVLLLNELQKQQATIANLTDRVERLEKA